MRRLLGIPVVLATLSVPAFASAATLYADNSLSTDCAGNYDPAARTCGGGSDVAYASLAAASAAATAGDTVSIRGGTFAEPLVAATSGADGQPITFGAYPGESPVLSGVDAPAIQVTGRSYVVVRGLAVTDVLGWGRLEDASHVLIENCTFMAATATGTTGGFKLVRSSDNRLSGNRFEDGNDNVVVQESDRNVLSGNTFLKGRHSLLSVRCGDSNVIRGNRFDNPDQKAGEIYDCEGVSDAPFELDATKRNLFEQNVFAGTLASTRSYDYNAIQYAGQDGIVRFNVFHDNLGGGLHFQVYADEALHNYGHRAYRNTFVANACYGIGASASVSPTEYFDIVVKGNLFFGNTDCSGGPEQTSTGNTAAVLFVDNAIATASPAFVDEAGRDLHLALGSPMIDAGPFLTTALGAGSGTSFPVADAAYFFDGGGVAGEVGDVVQLEGQSATARIVAVDLAANVLTLDAPLAWTDGANVALSYVGVAPDMGAYEFGAPSEPGAGGSNGTGGGGSGGGGSGSPATGGGAGSGGMPSSAGGSGGVAGGASSPGGRGGSGAPSPDGGAAPPAGARAGDESGCGCRSARVPRGGLDAVLIALAGLGLVRGRRWDRRRPRPVARDAGSGLLG